MPRRYDESSLTMADLEAMSEKCSNWGRWGPDDEIGTLNFIGPEELKHSAKMVKQGKSNLDHSALYLLLKRFKKY